MLQTKSVEFKASQDWVEENYNQEEIEEALNMIADIKLIFENGDKDVSLRDVENILEEALK